MKICCDCHQEKPLEAFNKSKRDGFQRVCRDCSKIRYNTNRITRLEQVRKRERDLQEYIWSKRRNGFCVRCGFSDYRALCYHHQNPNEKEFSIAQAANRGWSKDRIDREISKCVLLCANCHAIEHFPDNTLVSHNGSANAFEALRM